MYDWLLWLDDVTLVTGYCVTLHDDDVTLVTVTRWCMTGYCDYMM